MKEQLEARAKALQAELDGLKREIEKIDADPVVVSCECLTMSAGYLYPLPEKDKCFNGTLVADFNASKNKPACFGALANGEHRIVKLSLHKSGKFTVEDTGKVFNPWGDDFKPLVELNLEVGDMVEFREKVHDTDKDSSMPYLIGRFWQKSSTLARKV